MTTFGTPQELLENVGTDFGWTDWLDVDQSVINSFADVTGDHQWIHTEPDRAAESPFGGTIAHGMLVLSLVSPRVAGLFTIERMSAGVNYGFDKVRFTAPVPAGARLRVGAVLSRAEAVTGGVRCWFDATVEVEGTERPVCVAQNIIQFAD